MMFWLRSIVLFLLWLLLSGRFDALHMGMGVAASLVVSWMAHDLVLVRKELTVKHRTVHFVRFLGYFGWLLKEIVLAAAHVWGLAFLPRLEDGLSPRVLRFKTRLRTEFAQFVFATSITLTPGTVTIRIEDGEFVVHAINEKMASGLPGEMEERILRVFEPPEEEAGP